MNLATIGSRVSRLFARGGRSEAIQRAMPSTFQERFDISDHGVELPDLADFPECRSLGKVPVPTGIDGILAKLSQSLDKTDVAGFREGLGQLQNAMVSQCAFSDGQREILETQLKNVDRMAAVYLTHKHERDQTVRDDLPVSSTYHSIREEGVAPLNVDTAEVRGILAAEIDQLVSNQVTDICRPGDGYDRSKTFVPEDNPALFEALSKAFQPHEVFSAATKYHRVREDLKFKFACLHVCSPEDTHFTQCLQDCETTSQLIGLHYDPKPAMKIILYLNDVTEQSGPFCFIPRSHRWRFDELEMVFGKGTSTGNYLNSPEHRRVAISFPERLRKTGLMGRLVPDGSPLSEKLLAEEVRFLSSTANCMVFDAGQGWHRGGICQSGMRINLQIALA